MRGRKPKSHHLKVLEGTARPEPKPKPLIGSCPSILTGKARESWQHFARECNWLTAADVILLTVLCAEIGIWHEARVIIKREGIIDDSRPTPKPHPALKVSRDSEAMILRLCQEFGMTPASRSRLSLPVPDEDEEEWDW